MTPEHSMYMIKPEAMDSRDEIRDLIRRDLAITAIKTLRLPQWVIRELYDDLNDNLRIATDIALRGTVELGVVEGEDAIATMLDIAGDKTNPSECTPDSIRFRFGVHLPLIVNGTPYYLNALHRPKSAEEARTHVAIVHRLNEDM